jgi:hypothetical protein
MRIYSLLPSATEIVASLGLADSLVAVSEERDWPPRVRELPVVPASRVDRNRLSSLEIEQAVRDSRRVLSLRGPLQPINPSTHQPINPSMPERKAGSGSGIAPRPGPLNSTLHLAPPGSTPRGVA